MLSYPKARLFKRKKSVHNPLFGYEFHYPAASSIRGVRVCVRVRKPLIEPLIRVRVYLEDDTILVFLSSHRIALFQKPHEGIDAG